MIAWLAAAALAQPQPLVGVSGAALGDVSGGGRHAGGGGALVAGVRAIGPLWLELAVEAGGERALDGSDPSPWRVGITPVVRVFLPRREDMAVAPSLAIRGGTEIGPDGTDAVVGGDVALDVRLGRDSDWALRAELGALTRDLPKAALRGGLGVVFTPRRRETPAPAPEGVWLPYPRCAWVDRNEAHAWLAARGSGPVGGEGAAADGAAVGNGPTNTPAARAQGALFVAAAPGDVLTVGEGPASPAADDGVASWLAPDGLVTVTVTGGGRRVQRRATVSEGYATWVRVPPPKEVRFTFDRGSALVRPADRDRLRELAERTGGWRWMVHGSHSPEGGDATNERLALERAEAVRAALLAAGLAEPAVVIGPSEPPDARVPEEAQRSVRLVPVPPGEAP